MMDFAMFDCTKHVICFNIFTNDCEHLVNIFKIVMSAYTLRTLQLATQIGFWFMHQNPKSDYDLSLFIVN